MNGRDFGKAMEDIIDLKTTLGDGYRFALNGWMSVLILKKD